ncbi:MAG: hypothetical protein R3C49_15655 [Planctomycetaceae bacterium]
MLRLLTMILALGAFCDVGMAQGYHYNNYFYSYSAPAQQNYGNAGGYGLPLAGGYGMGYGAQLGGLGGYGAYPAVGYQAYVVPVMYRVPIFIAPQRTVRTAPVCSTCEAAPYCPPATSPSVAGPASTVPQVPEFAP